MLRRHRWRVPFFGGDMIYLVCGLVVFLGLHSFRIFASAWREARIAAWGVGAWKTAVSLLSIAAFVLVIWGYGEAKAVQPLLLWTPPTGLRPAVGPLTLLAFILLAAAYVPRNHIRARLRHPMVLAVKLWALAHLLVNGWLPGVVLFGSFLAWAILDFRAARRREPAPGAAAGVRVSNTAMAVAIGAAAWAGFAFQLHARWVGVAPFG